jgi:hypothetical protein
MSELGLAGVMVCDVRSISFQPRMKVPFKGIPGSRF